MARRSWLLLFVFVVAALFLSGCIPGNGSYSASEPAGFFSGIWHGWIAPLSLLIGLFNPDIRVYETANVGWWYDFAFYLAIVGGFGGISLSRRGRS